MNNGQLSTLILVAIIGNLALMSFIVLPVIRRRRAPTSSPAAATTPSSAPTRVIDTPDTSLDVDVPAGVEANPTDKPSQPLDSGDQEPDMDRTENEPARPTSLALPQDDAAGDAIEAFLSDVRRAAEEAEGVKPALPSATGSDAPTSGGPKGDAPTKAGEDAPTVGSQLESPEPRPNGRTEGWTRPADRGPDPAALADAVTGLHGPAAWSHAVAQEAARSSRYGRPVAVVIAELDGLDPLEERFGPEAADRLIPPVADVLRRSARSADTIARLDRVRFGLLLPETDEIQAINLVERIRAGCDRWLAAGPVSVRLSIGWASPPVGGDLANALREAEERMHREQQRPAG
jgi:diguanylate cyclase (GGDEF)-like protein